jgi:hypothetical protein
MTWARAEVLRAAVDHRLWRRDQVGWPATTYMETTGTDDPRVARLLVRKVTARALTLEAERLVVVDAGRERRAYGVCVPLTATVAGAAALTEWTERMATR